MVVTLVTHSFGAVGYADDVTLLTPTLSGLKHILHVSEYHVKFNPSKSKLLVFGRDADKATVVYFNGLKLQIQ